MGTEENNKWRFLEVDYWTIIIIIIIMIVALSKDEKHCPFLGTLDYHPKTVCKVFQGVNFKNPTYDYSLPSPRPRSADLKLINQIVYVRQQITYPYFAWKLWFVSQFSFAFIRQFAAQSKLLTGLVRRFSAKLIWIILLGFIVISILAYFSAKCSCWNISTTKNCWELQSWTKYIGTA